jgi:hypothetical protein
MIEVHLPICVCTLLIIAVTDHLLKLGVKLVLGERVSTPAEFLIGDDGREKIVRTGPGGEYPADLVVSTLEPVILDT